MRFIAQVVAADGSPLAEGTAELLAPGGSLATAKIRQGALSLTAEPGPVWGLAIDGHPVLAVPVSATAKRVDLGEIVLVTDGIPWPAFHASDGRVFGAPRSVLASARPARAEPTFAAAAPEGAPATAGPAFDALADIKARLTLLEADMARRVAAAAVAAPRTAATAAPVAATDVTKPSMTFGSMLGSTAQQLTSAAVAKTGLTLAGATLAVKGIPISTQDAIGLEFPTAEVAAVGTGLTELSFSLKAAPPAATATSVPKGPTVPDLGSYTRDLATRKLAALGLFGEFTSEVVSDPSHVGRVVRQLPKPGSDASPGAIIRLFIGK